jgi:hypothetical protein
MLILTACQEEMPRNRPTISPFGNSIGNTPIDDIEPEIERVERPSGQIVF